MEHHRASWLGLGLGRATTTIACTSTSTSTQCRHSNDIIPHRMTKRDTFMTSKDKVECMLQQLPARALAVVSLLVYCVATETIHYTIMYIMLYHIVVVIVRINYG